MTAIISIKNKIQVSIIDYLYRHGPAQFTDMRPAKVQTNLFSYHVNKLLSDGAIKKQGTTYQLAAKGAQYARRVLDHPPAQTQPSIKLAFVIQNSDGDVFLTQTNDNTWDIPYAVLDIDQRALTTVAQEAMTSTFHIPVDTLRHAGDCYVRIIEDDRVLDNTLVHVFYMQSDEIVETDKRTYVGLHSLGRYTLAPGAEPIMSRTFFGDNFFFEEFDQSPLY